jgi:hypothetical protein
MTPDARFVVFQSGATNLVADVLLPGSHVYRHDRATGETILLDATPQGLPSNGNAIDAAISADGRFVSFRSGATDLAPVTTPVLWPIYVRDLETGAVALASVSTLGQEASLIGQHSLSGDGRFVTFETATGLSPLVSQDPYGAPDVFVHDVVTGLTRLVSGDALGNATGTWSHVGTVSRDGRAVAYAAGAAFMPQDINSTWDVYVYDRLHAPTWTELGPGLAGTAGVPAFDGDGPLKEDAPVFLGLGKARASAMATLVVGLANIGIPFKGGTLVPSPNILMTLQTNAEGKLLLATNVPHGTPAGLELFLQFWIADPEGPHGFAASNGLHALTP